MHVRQHAHSLHSMLHGASRLAGRLPADTEIRRYGDTEIRRYGDEGGGSMFVHLHVHSLYSMLHGASRLEELLQKAAWEGAAALALTDRDSVAGLAEFLRLAPQYGVRPISGVDMALEEEGRIVLLAQNDEGYEQICHLVTEAHQINRLFPQISRSGLSRYKDGLIALTGGRFSDVSACLLRREYRLARERLLFYRNLYGRDQLYVALSRTSLPGDAPLVKHLLRLASECGLGVVAVNDVRYAVPSDFPVHDILVCMRTKTTVDQAHPDRPLNSENDLKSAEQMKALFADCPEAVANTALIAQRCAETPRLGQSLFPRFTVPDGYENGMAMLRQLVYQGAAKRYGSMAEAPRARLDHELEIIRQLGYVDYFLVVWDIVAFARRQNIRYAGRGSAADSAVAYCLYITDVDAAGRHLLFERFMSLERAEKPDIDIDFDSRRRDEVRAYVYRRYGADHVASVCTYSTFRGRSAVREIGKALALPEKVCADLAKRIPYMLHADQIDMALDRFPELRAAYIPKDRLRLLLTLAKQLAGFPRHFGTHVGGVVISHTPLLRITPLQPSARGVLITQFDKEGAENLGLVKLDLLALRTMSAIEDASRQLEEQGRPLDYDGIPLDDAETFEMIARGETIGVFQLESPAQRALQSRLGARALEDIVASVALIRPGPIKGNMVDPFLTRKKGLEVVTYLHPKLEPILGKTYGVVLFQEQVIEIATAIADFTPGEADQLRRVMSRARSGAEMENIGRDFVRKALRCGVHEQVAETIFSYMRAYASYGFCEAHAAAFAATAYKTAYLARHMPAEFFASIINAQPMGYYPRHVLAAEARRRGVGILGVDVNRSAVQAEASEGRIRLGFLQVLGMREEAARHIDLARRGGGPFTSLSDFCERIVDIDRVSAERLICAGAFDSLQGNRKALLWALPEAIAASRAVRESGKLIACGRCERDERRFAVNDFSPQERLANEYQILGMGVSGHWMAQYRDELTKMDCLPIDEVLAREDGTVVSMAGIIIRPHRPPTKSGRTVVFFSLEDETGMADVTVFQDVYQRDGAVLFAPRRHMVGVQGVLQRRQGGTPQIMARRVWGL